jgi:hypothetical protein
MGREKMVKLTKQRSLKGIFISLLVTAVLVVSVCVQVQGQYAKPYFKFASEENVLVPLVEEYDNTGIPVTLDSDFVSIRLIYPLEQELHIPLNDRENGDSPASITVIIFHDGVVDSEVIYLQDWPQSGPVIPLSQDWPQDGILLFHLQDLPNKTFLSLVIQQDWPQYMIDGELI